MSTSATEARLIFVIVICCLWMLLLLGDVINVNRMAYQWRVYLAQRENIINDNVITNPLQQNRCNSENQNSNTCNELVSSANTRELVHKNEQNKQSPQAQEWSEEVKQQKFLSKCKEQLVSDKFQSSFIEWVHPGLKIRCFNWFKREGIKTTQQIKFGDILAVELPFFKIVDEDLFSKLDSVLLASYYIGSGVEWMMTRNPEFKQLWDHLDTNQGEFERTREMVKSSVTEQEMDSPEIQLAISSFAKFTTNHLGQIAHPPRKPWALYSVLSKINFGIPQNVAAIFSDKEDGYRCVLIATRDIQVGEELVIDYYLDWDDKSALDRTPVRAMKGRGFAFHLDDKAIDATKELTSKTVSKQRKAEVFRHIYPNGIKGRAPGEPGLAALKGRGNLDETSYQRKLEIIKSVKTGDIFKALRGEIDLPDWMKNQVTMQEFFNTLK